MDFRSLEPADLRWTRGGGAPGGARVRPQPTIQTPRCRARVTEIAPGRARVDLRLADITEPEPADGPALFEAFAGTCEALEAGAAHALGLGGDGTSKALFATVLRGGGGAMRVTAFDECEWFDADGAFLKGEAATAARAAAGEASCVLTLTGAWESGARWGLRWKVVQVKLWPRAAAGDDATAHAVPMPKPKPKPQPAEYAFID
jgi:hypothetical protein